MRKDRKRETHKGRKSAKTALCPSFLSVFRFLERPVCSVQNRNSSPQRSSLRLLITIGIWKDAFTIRVLFWGASFNPGQGCIQGRKHSLHIRLQTLIGGEGDGPWKNPSFNNTDRVLLAWVPEHNKQISLHFSGVV